MADIVYILLFDKFCRLNDCWTLGCRCVNWISCYCPEVCCGNTSCNFAQIAANSLTLHVWNQVLHRLLKMQAQNGVMYLGLSMSTLGMECVVVSGSNNCRHSCINNCLQPTAVMITQGAWGNLVEDLSYSVSGWGWERIADAVDCVASLWIEKKQWYIIVRILCLTLGYLTVTKKSEIWNAEWEIGTQVSVQIWQHLWFDKWLYRFRPPRVGELGCCTGHVVNWIISAVQTCPAARLPGLVVNSFLQHPGQWTLALPLSSFQSCVCFPWYSVLGYHLTVPCS